MIDTRLVRTIEAAGQAPRPSGWTQVRCFAARFVEGEQLSTTVDRRAARFSLTSTLLDASVPPGLKCPLQWTDSAQNSGITRSYSTRVEKCSTGVEEDSTRVEENSSGVERGPCGELDCCRLALRGELRPGSRVLPGRSMFLQSSARVLRGRPSLHAGWGPRLVLPASVADVPLLVLEFPATRASLSAGVLVSAPGLLKPALAACGSTGYEG